MSACSNKEEQVYTNTEMWNMAKEIEPSIELVPITTDDKRVLCENYGPGCRQGSGKRIKVRKVELLVLEFDSTKNAREEAKKIGQYHARNWLLDDVSNEPVLESFVKKAFAAKKP